MKTLKATIIFAFILLFTQTVFSQRQSLTVARLKNGSAFLEMYQENVSLGSLLGNTSYGSNDTYKTNEGKYWITAQTNISLQSALRKAISWAKLNEEHQKDFEKEIIRFRVTDKKTFDFYRRYIPEFTSEAKLIFKGNSDNTFSVELSISDDVVSAEFNSVEELKDFISLLQGKATNDVDKIFN